MLISRNDYLSPLKIIIRRPGKVTLKPRLNDQTISSHSLILYSYVLSLYVICVFMYMYVALL